MSCLAGVAKRAVRKPFQLATWIRVFRIIVGNNQILDWGQEGVQEGSQVWGIVQRVNGSDNLWEEIEMKQMSGGECVGGEKWCLIPY